MATPVVFVAHADQLLRATLRTLMGESGWQVRLFDDAQTLLSQLHADGAACLILDVQLPDIDGLELQAMLASRRDIPVIFIANNPSVRAIVRAMKAGAVEVLTMPLDDELLLDAIRQALQLSATVRAREVKQSLLRQRYERLSRREREVMSYVVHGHMNKNTAMDLGISEITVKVHRGQVMRKMQAHSLADLVSMAMALCIDPPVPASTIETFAAHAELVSHCA